MTAVERAVVEAACAAVDAGKRLHDVRLDAPARGAPMLAGIKANQDEHLALATVCGADAAMVEAVDAYRNAAQVPAEPRYPCATCGKLRTKAEGGECLTTCEGLGFNCDGTIETYREEIP